MRVDVADAQNPRSLPSKSGEGARTDACSAGASALRSSVVSTLALHIVFIPALFLFGVYSGWQLREMREAAPAPPPPGGPVAPKEPERRP